MRGAVTVDPRHIKKELLSLKKEYSLFIVSSNKEKTIKNYLLNNSLSNIFTEILGFETHKSKVEKFKILMKKYDITPKDCIFITDTLGDILEAHKVGLRTIAVDFGFHERARLEKGKPLKIISKFEDIASTLREIS